MVGCAGSEPEFTSVRRDALRDSALAFVASIPDHLVDRGPIGWLDLFATTPDFFMASDGGMAFANRDSAAAFLARFAPTVSRMTLQFDDLRAEPLAPGLAVVFAGYRETIETTDGTTPRFGGAMTAVVRHGDTGWRLQHLHWSSPPP